MDYKYVTTVAEVKKYIGGAKIIGFDFETSPTEEYRSERKAALDSHKSHITGVSFSISEESAIYVPIAHRVGINADKTEIKEFLTEFAVNPNIVKVAHNLSFEAMFLYALGIIVQPPCYDTIAAAQLTLKNNTKFRTLADCGLKTLVPELLDMELPSYADVTDGRAFDELDPQDAETIRYACADADYALRLYHLFNNWFDRFMPKHRFIVEQIESPTAVYVGIMRYNGLLMDKELMLSKQAEAEAKLAQIKDNITFMIGDVNIGDNAGTSAFKKYLYEDLKLPVFKTTAKNREAIDDETLILLSEWCTENKPELAKLFKLVQEYRKWGKIKSTYIEGYLEHINEATGRIHPQLLQLGAESGRFSCCAPNLQNLSQSSNAPFNIRDFIIAQNGYSIVEADFSQVELKIAAVLSRDPVMIEAYKNGEDIHALTTAAIYQIPLTEASDKTNHLYKKRRTVAKSTIFGFLYGIYPKGLQRNLKTAAGIDLSIGDCTAFLTNLKRKYHTLAKWQERTISNAKWRRYAETALGRRRYVPDIQSTDFMKRGRSERAALNHGVQGLAADCLKLTMARLLNELETHRYLQPVLTVHDSLVFLCPDDKVRDAARIILTCMETLPPIEGFDIILNAEVSVGKSYGSLKEIEVWDYEQTY